MKTPTLITAICVFLLSFTGKEDSEVWGTWIGGFGDEKAITETFVELKQQNNAIVYEGAKLETNKCFGVYEVKGDTALILTYIQPVTNKQVSLLGNLNKSKNFVDGVMQTGSEVKGNFYLEKQPL